MMKNRVFPRLVALLLALALPFAPGALAETAGETAVIGGADGPAEILLADAVSFPGMMSMQRLREEYAAGKPIVSETEIDLEMDNITQLAASFGAIMDEQTRQSLAILPLLFDKFTVRSSMSQESVDMAFLMDSDVLDVGVELNEETLLAFAALVPGGGEAVAMLLEQVKTAMPGFDLPAILARAGTLQSLLDAYLQDMQAWLVEEEIVSVQPGEFTMDGDTEVYDEYIEITATKNQLGRLLVRWLERLEADTALQDIMLEMAIYAASASGVQEPITREEFLAELAAYKESILSDIAPVATPEEPSDGAQGEISADAAQTPETPAEPSAQPEEAPGSVDFVALQIAALRNSGALLADVYLYEDESGALTAYFYLENTTGANDLYSALYVALPEEGINEMLGIEAAWDENGAWNASFVLGVENGGDSNDLGAILDRLYSGASEGVIMSVNMTAALEEQTEKSQGDITMYASGMGFTGTFETVADLGETYSETTSGAIYLQMATPLLLGTFNTTITTAAGE